MRRERGGKGRSSRGHGGHAGGAGGKGPKAQRGHGGSRATRSQRVGVSEAQPRQAKAERRKQSEAVGMQRLLARGRLIEGWNPVLEALRAGRRIERIWLAADRNKNAQELMELAAERDIPVETVDRVQLGEIASSDEHQGVVALAPQFVYTPVDDILMAAAAKGEPPFLLILDHIEDPHNLGSLIRTAECVGAHGAIIPDRRAAGVTPAVGKASAGAIEHLPVAQVGNLVQEMERLKEQGIWMVGAHMTGDQSLFTADLSGPIGLVIGAEGKGLSRLVAERCDMLVSIPMAGRVNSLNASVAGALLMYEVMRARQR